MILDTRRNASVHPKGLHAEGPASSISLKRARTVFISDVHLGSRHSNPISLLRFLEEVCPHRLYLVGDFIDGWRLRKRWQWKPVYNEILHRLIQMQRLGVKIHYAPGNHDEFLRPFLYNLGLVVLKDEFVHEFPDGRRYLVMHGDQFDSVELRAKWLSKVGATGYETLLWLNAEINRFRRWQGLGPACFSRTIKLGVKCVVNHISRFEELVTKYARNIGCDGVICGHIHSPVLNRQADVNYCNTGDWIEHCSAIVEDEHGDLSLTWRPPDAMLGAASPKAHQRRGALAPFTLSASGEAKPHLVEA